MLTQIKAALRDSGALAEDFAGAAALAILLVTVLHLPVLA